MKQRHAERETAGGKRSDYLSWVADAEVVGGRMWNSWLNVVCDVEGRTMRFVEGPMTEVDTSSRRKGV